MAEMYDLGAQVLRSAREAPPTARTVLSVTTAHDPAVNNAITQLLMDRWQARGAANLRTFAFGPGLGAIHDVIDPDQPYQRSEVTHRALVDLIERLGT
jgi:hypothetical protein